jgi:hypothetical protein
MKNTQVNMIIYTVPALWSIRAAAFVVLGVYPTACKRDISERLRKWMGNSVNASFTHARFNVGVLPKAAEF